MRQQHHSLGADEERALAGQFARTGERLDFLRRAGVAIVPGNRNGLFLGHRSSREDVVDHGIERPTLSVRRGAFGAYGDGSSQPQSAEDRVRMWHPMSPKVAVPKSIRLRQFTG